MGHKTNNPGHVKCSGLSHIYILIKVRETYSSEEGSSS